MMAAHGWDVHVFTANPPETPPSLAAQLHCVDADRARFSEAVADVFAAEHRDRLFDVVEGPEFGGDLFHIANRFPDLPTVVKLHTASFVISEINHAYLPFSSKARFVLGALRRGRVPHAYWRRYDAAGDRERAITLGADEVTSPSQALVDVTTKRWPIDRARTVVIPNTFDAPDALLAIDPETRTNRITFIGKIEVRKGVLELAAAIPMVLDAAPDTKFRFIGRTMPVPGTATDTVSMMKRSLARHTSQVEFTGDLDYPDVLAALRETDIGVFPSYWENFPYVCMEAMAAARGVVGSASGGMAEIIDDGRTGVLVQPKDPKAIARALLTLLNAPKRRIAMGAAARRHIVNTYGANTIAPQQAASYQRAIKRADARRADRGGVA